jgi:putative addiction module CopG family antidote
MNVELTPDQRAFVRRAIESGRFAREEEAVQEALALWEERERRRLEILAAVDEAEASLARELLGCDEATPARTMHVAEKLCQLDVRIEGER